MANRREDKPHAATRWEGRPVQAGLLRVAAVAVPVAAGVLASAVFSRLIGYPDGLLAVAVWWILVLAVSSATVMVVERQCRRLLPLATLLKLSMIFPDKAPSRFGVALRAGSVRNLEERVIEMRSRGVDDEPSRAAQQILELVGAMSVHDRGTRGHAERVRAYSDLLAIQMGLTDDERDRLRWAALLHDVGKVAVPSEILNKPGAPDEDEWAIIHRHPEEGAKLVAPLRHWLGEWVYTIEQHHERWDGQGYPHKLAGTEISRGARLVAVADAFEVMTAARSYKKPMDVKAAREELTAGAGSQFDPAAVRAFLMISLGRTRWMVGPLAWVAQLPFLQGLGGTVAGVGGQVAGVVTRVVAAATLFATAAAPAAASGAPNARVARGENSAPATAGQPGATPGDTVSAGDPGGPAPDAPALGAPAPGAPAPGPGGPVPAGGPGAVAPPAGGGAPPPSGGPAPSPNAAPPTTKAPVKPAPTTTAPPVTSPPGTNHPPVAVNDAAVSTSAGAQPFDIPVSANDYDPDGNDQLVYPITLLDAPGKANVSVTNGGHDVHYVPNNQKAGTYVFHYQVCDTEGACATGTVTVTQP